MRRPDLNPASSRPAAGPTAPPAGPRPYPLAPPAEAPRADLRPRLGAAFSIGVALQRRLRDPHRASHTIFTLVLWVMSPLVVIYAYTTVVVRAELFAAFGCLVAATWITLGVGMLWGRLAGRGTREAGVMAFATAMGNCGTLGFPLTTLAFGGQGLALAVIYAEFQYLIPTDGVMLGLGRHYAGPNSKGLRAPGLRKLRAQLAPQPAGDRRGGRRGPAPRRASDLTAVRVADRPVRRPAVRAGRLSADRPRHLAGAAGPRPQRLWRAAVTIALRCGLLASVLLALGWVTGVHIPGVFLLLAAMPVAFNTLVLSAVFDLDRELARLLVAVSTPLVIAAVLIWQLVSG